jgi:addiction module RelE/StbE family toxin
MLIIIHTSKFDKQFRILSEKIQRKTIDRLQIFIKDEFCEILNNHQLHGEYVGCRSINITGNIRLVYKEVNKGTCRLVAIGTHNQLYE